MPQHRTTLKDIAEQLGITVTSVSKALKDYPDISKATKAAVMKLATEMNYQPDSRAQALRRNKSNTIGVIVPEIVHFFFSTVIQGIMDYTEKHGYRVLIALSDNKRDLEKKQVNLFYNTRVDGVLVSLANESESISHFDVLTNHGIPLVMFDKVSKELDCHKIKIDDNHSAFIATEHLIERGCKKIAHIRGPKTPLNSKARYKGYVKALNKHNLEVDKSLIKVCKDVTLKEGYEFALELLNSKNKPDGIFAVTDQVGVGAIQAAHELGISVPGELKVVGFSDSQVAQIVKPGLTTIHQPGYEIGEHAAKLLIEEIEMREVDSDIKVNFQKVVLDTHLIEREST